MHTQMVLLAFMLLWSDTRHGRGIASSLGVVAVMVYLSPQLATFSIDASPMANDSSLMGNFFLQQINVDDSQEDNEEPFGSQVKSFICCHLLS